MTEQHEVITERQLKSVFMPGLLEIDDYDISSQPYLHINPFCQGCDQADRSKTSIGYGKATVFDALVYLYRIDSLLSWRLVFSDCLKYGIHRVGTDGGFCNRSWKQGLWGLYGSFDGWNYINLNPHLNREEVAEQIQQEHDISIKPSEIYYWIWFHEVGHHLNQKATRKVLEMELDHLFGKAVASDVFRKAKKNSESLANKYANARFIRRKKEGVKEQLY